MIRKGILTALCGALCCGCATTNTGQYSNAAGSPVVIDSVAVQRQHTAQWNDIMVIDVEYTAAEYVTGIEFRVSGLTSFDEELPTVYGWEYDMDGKMRIDGVTAQANLIGPYCTASVVITKVRTRNGIVDFTKEPVVARIER